jgi:flagellar hook-associated protein 1 FlgK
VVLTDPRAIAAASPLTTGVALTNLSDAAVSGATVDDIADPNLLRAVQIRFDDSNTYRILDGGGADLTGPLAYTSGDDISFQGFTVQVSGSAVAGDVFNVRATSAGSGDNTNALALSEIAAKGFFNNGELSVAGVGANLVANVGSASARATNELSVQTLLRDQAQLDLESVAGVNLDEEAVNILRFQEAYLASSKIITVANELFQSLLGAIGR